MVFISGCFLEGQHQEEKVAALLNFGRTTIDMVLEYLNLLIIEY